MLTIFIDSADVLSHCAGTVSENYSKRILSDSPRALSVQESFPGNRRKQSRRKASFQDDVWKSFLFQQAWCIPVPPERPHHPLACLHAMPYLCYERLPSRRRPYEGLSA